MNKPNANRADEIATLALHALLELNEDYAMEIFKGDMDLTSEEIEYYGLNFEDDEEFY